MTHTEALLLFTLNPYYTEDELRDKWRFFCKHYHPDLGHNQEYFKRLVEAHQVLQNYRSQRGAKQEWFDHVSRQSHCQLVIEPSLIAPIMATAGGITTYVVLLNSSTAWLQQVYLLQLKLSALSGSAYHILTPK